MAKFDLEALRHSTAHLMAAAVQELYEDVKFDIGPSTEDGFYYDFDLAHRFTPDDLTTIEQAMRKLVNKRLPFERFELSRDEAETLLKEQGQTYKLERLAAVPEGEVISFYRLGDFVDLCRGPHVENSGQIAAFKLLTIAGSYYRGDENNPMLQRIYGTAFEDKKAMNDYFQMLEEAKKRDHRKLGRELDLFSFSDTVGPGLVLWHPKGAFVRHTFETYWRDAHYKNGYDMLYTPNLGRSALWETSGHLDFYKDSMYSPMEIDEQNYYVKPMNCPFHIEIYKSRIHSYRELPLRWAELGTVYRYEKSGTLHGLLRVRGFTQDDAHIICTPEQIEHEISEVLRFSLQVWKDFGFKEIKPYLATRPAKAVGEPERWDLAIKSLEKAVADAGLVCEIDEGGGAFYGPKIDLKIKDAIGREWQTSTIQFDFNLPDRFDMTYIGDDGKKHRPFMVHRALLGSIERFFGILVENYAGAFPLWLAPEHARIMPITDRQHDFAVKVLAELKQLGFRVSLDDRSESVNAKIKNARNERIPYMLVIGDREVENGTMAVRSRREGQLGEMDIKQIADKMRLEIENKEC
ncbi:MAG: threonine--tRNA ligase [Victivallaceae bacterium]|nr:threonine--tRNA ligase [Victivallaceae bacterium]MDD4181925.1 threonine--tRNA ligase [Victivallaceae bacterium]